MTPLAPLGKQLSCHDSPVELLAEDKSIRNGGGGHRSTGRCELAGRKLRRAFTSVVKICGFSENKRWAEPETGQCLPPSVMALQYHAMAMNDMGSARTMMAIV
jgi:hypothetical protein